MDGVLAAGGGCGLSGNTESLGEASERDVFGYGLPRRAGLSMWVKRKSRTAERLAKRSPGMTRAQIQRSTGQARTGPARPGGRRDRDQAARSGRGGGPSHMFQGMQAGDLVAEAQLLVLPWRRWMIAHAIGHKLLHPGNTS